MAKMVPKGPRANVASIDNARARKGGRPSGLGYDPATGDEHQTGSGGLQAGDAAETDVFKLVGQRGYSESRFYTKSTNEHNHGEQLRVRVPQGIDSQIYAAVAEVPEYRSQQDFWRDAAVHRLEYLQKRYKLGEEARMQLELERLRADSERRAANIQLMRDTVADLETKLGGAWEAGDYAMLAKELEEGQELIDWLREPYRTQVRDTLKRWEAKARDVIAKMRAALED